MKIGIDISQLAYQNTGVANYLGRLVEHLVSRDDENEYILFFSSMRKNFQFSVFNFQSNANVTVKQFKFPPTLLDLLWNKLHVLPIENLIGDVDVFITSDWTEPPVKRAKKMTILYDLIVYKYPEETAKSIIQTQKRKLAWVKKETDMILCISEATKKDASEILEIGGERLRVIYPGT
jgi:hypothetical protein